MTWNPDPDLFLADVEDKPAALRLLADALEAERPWDGLGLDAARRVVLLGMGSSRFAALPAAARLRAGGMDAVAEYANAVSAHPGGVGTVAIGISASGRSEETVAALRRHRDAGSDTIALTDDLSSVLAQEADHVVEMLAGPERGGVACRTFQHTLALLLSLEEADGTTARWVRAAADATEDLLARRDDWLPAAVELLTATGSAFLLAPNERHSSAEQGALMLREGPRLHADSCETGDWLHVDVYLTKSLDYRALLFAGSAADRAAMRWMDERGAKVLIVGGELDGGAHTIRYRGDDGDEVALLTEVLVPELIAAEVWRTG